MLSQDFGKGVTVFGFLRFLSFYLFACVATDCSTQRGVAWHGLAWRGVEDAYQTLKAIPFKVGVNSPS